MKSPRKVKISTFGSQLTSAISVALALLLLGLMSMAIVASRGIADEIRSNVGIIVKLLPGADQAEIDRVGKLISDNRGTAAVTYSSPEQILAEESELLDTDITAMLDENPFGPEYDISVKPDYANSDSIEALAAMYGADESVDEVVTETAVIDSINDVLNKAAWILLIAAIALLIISIALITNTVRLSVYSRRFIIYTMTLVGATNAFIRRPFVVSGVVTGAIAACIAIACAAAVRGYVATFDPMIADVLSWADMCWIFGGMLVVGTCICTLASAIAANRYLRSGFDDLYSH